MEILTTKREPMLTPRLQEVICLIAYPYSRKQMREILGMKKKTLESHITRIMDKTGVHDHIELIAYAQQHGYGKQEVTL